MTLPETNNRTCTECKLDVSTIECTTCRRPFCARHTLNHECRLLKYKMVFLVRKDLNMSAGKIAAQVAHAAVDLLYSAIGHISLSEYHTDIQKWHEEGGKKVVLEVADNGELDQYCQLAVDKGLRAVKIMDYGLTEVPKNSITVAGIGPALSDDIDIVTGGLKTLK